jgi:ABC-type Mn2+/Zn2+ transport system ATPase subunit
LVPDSPDHCSACGGHEHGGRRVPPARILVRLRGAGVRYEAGGEWAVHGVDLEIGPGEIVSLIGPNGAGKSSLLRALAGLQPLAEGTVEWGEVNGKKPTLGYVPQQPALDRDLPVSVTEFLRLKLRGERGWGWFQGSGGAVRDEAARRLGELGVGALADRRLGELSGGELQRVLIAYSLIGDPQLLLLDEPMTGVDIKGGSDFQDLVAGLRASRGLSVLMVSHDLHMVGALSDVVVCLNRHLCATGTPAEVLQDHVLSGIYGSQVGLAKGKR